jgi:general secretion pathway protein F
MPQFSYKAKAGPGQIRTGIIEAHNAVVAVKKLRLEGLFPLSIAESGGVSVKKGFKGITQREISEFTRQLADLIHSGFLLSTALTTLSQQSSNAKLKAVIESLEEDIKKGAAFSDGLERYPNFFSSFYISMVKIGEASGKIEETLGRLADFKEREDEVASQMRSALVYPAFLLTVGIISVFILVSFFFTRLVNMFEGLGQRLPLPTLILIQVSKFMGKYGVALAIGITAIGAALSSFIKQERSRMMVDGFLLRLPFLNAIISKREIARFAYALGVLLKSGVAMLDALEVVALSVDNRVFREKINTFKEKIRGGQSLSKCLSNDAFFPPVLVNTVAVGEESGELTDMLVKIARHFETEVNRIVKTVVSLIEPMLILCIGGIVVLLVFAMLLPIFQIDFFRR